MTSAPSDTGTTAEPRADIRARLAAGTLPHRAQNQQIYGGYGEDQPCDCCGHRIVKTAVAYEIELLRNSSLLETLTMHLECFEVWVAESRFTSQSVAP
jgi:hypothetical protein